MAKSTEALIEDVRRRVHRLLYDDVIEQTIVVMRELSAALTQLATTVTGDRDAVSDAQKENLKSVLLPLYSESIREALHKGELPITNGIIRAKNRILKALDVSPPAGHEEIDPRDYPNYIW
ncbi:MAG: hypothetical protein U0797_15475 [Gemmataceae bacterium]